MKRSLFVLLVVSCLVFAFAATAQAYKEGEGEPWGANGPVASGDCLGCHATFPPGDATGPHGGYSDSTDKCTNCHDVHEAQSDNKLLPAATIFGICNSCHDASWQGTGGKGVYGAIRAQGQTVGARHNIQGYNNTVAAYEATPVIPGGNSSLSSTLTCSSCHTPHGNTAMTAFLGERYRVAPSVSPTSSTNKILQDDPRGTPKGTYTFYGSSWCGACHDRRHADNPTLNNHPVDTTTAYGAGSATGESGGPAWQTFVSSNTTLPARQAGWSREATNGWDPLCQQCHEDVRDVEAVWSVTSADGTVAADNPRFQTFPHETLSDNMTVETGDDLCLNCHPTSGLP